jgi:hypothetical protein
VSGYRPAAAQTQCIVAESQNADKEMKVALEEIRNSLSAVDQNSVQIARRLCSNRGSELRKLNTMYR